MINFKQYVKANLRLEELIDVVDDNTPLEKPLAEEFIKISDIIEQYEKIHFPIGLPTVQEMIELRMFEMGLKREDLAALLNTSTSRISDYLNGRGEITLKVAKALHQKLNIDGDIILQ
ncbi:helix-turn-helix domain-containing protein [uncultured Maribacter sp.]|jgi:HTH-type transcriptional regulator/antitoxin HigA|uniref:helix-turn-helix domain-containing protein n=1 Tax=uncultured Maribacter sp. TaxID=431308 RepID=UPI0030EE7A0B|tara:strand:- start:352 stop:705 length:354 start_codon:yes stop_codon:yes gene_type:complete